MGINVYPQTGGGLIKGTDENYYQAIMQKYPELNFQVNEGATSSNVKVIVEYGDYLFYATGNFIRKALKADPSIIIAHSPDYGGVITDMVVDSTGVYYGGNIGSPTIKKANLTTLTTIATSPAIPVFGAIAINSTGVYVANNQVVTKHNLTTLTVIATSPNYGNTIKAVAVDSTGVYYGGVTQTVIKANLLNLTTIATSSAQSSGILTIVVDSTGVYFNSTGSQNVIVKANLTTLSIMITSSEYATVVSKLFINSTGIYVGGGNNLYKADYSTLNVSSIGLPYGGVIRAISGEGEFIYIGGDITNKIMTFLTTESYKIANYGRVI